MKKLYRKIKKYVVPHLENDFKPILLRAGGVFFVIIFVAVTFFASSLYRSVLRKSDFLASILPAVLVDLANADRQSANLVKLAINPKLQEAARLKAKDMAAKSYFAHNSPEGKTPWYWIKEAEYSFVYAGENLAVDFNDSDAVNKAWMNSPGHRANIMNGKFTEVGIAAEKGLYNGKETIFVVQMFGTPAKPKPLIVSNTESKVLASDEAEEEIVPIAESSVLGQTFVAVEDKKAEPSEEKVVPQTADVSDLHDRVISSPVKMLGIIYGVLAAILASVLLFVLKTKHSNRARHVIIILALLMIIFAAFSYYESTSVSTVLAL